jgi:hypothetical protein
MEIEKAEFTWTITENNSFVVIFNVKNDTHILTKKVTQALIKAKAIFSYEAGETHVIDIKEARQIWEALVERGFKEVEWE